MLDQVKQFFDKVLSWLIWFYNAYKIVAWIVIILSGIFFLVKFFSALSFDLINIRHGITWISKKIWFLLKLPFLLIKKLYFFIRWIFQIRARILYKRSLKESVYNVIPSGYEIPKKYLIFFPKIRKQKKYRLKCIENCIATEEKINKEFQFIIMIEAAIGGGKTSFLNGFSHMKTLSLKQKIEEDLYDIEKKLYTVNYLYVRNLIRNYYDLGCSETEIKNKLLEHECIASSFTGTFSDHVSEIPKISLLESYIKAYVANLRDNYVMSNYKLYNRITNHFNYVLEPDAFDIKDPAAQKKFFLPPYLVIVDDEKALSEFKNTETPKNLDQKGTDVTMRLFRQLQRETTYYISSTQNTSRIALIIRELANTYVQIQRFAIVGEQNRLAGIYRKKEEKVYSKMIKFAGKHFETAEEQDRYLLSNNCFKSQIFELFDKQKELFASAFLSYSVRIAPKLDLLKEKDCKELKLVFPLTWCFGVYNTCEYSEFNDFLLTLSDVKTDQELKVISSLFEKNEDRYKKLIELKKKEKKEDGKEKDKKEKPKESKKDEKSS